MTHTHTPAEWAAHLSLGLVPVGLLRLALALFAEPDPGYYKAAAVDAAITVAAFLALLLPAHTKGAAR